MSEDAENSLSKQFKKKKKKTLTPKAFLFFKCGLLCVKNSADAWDKADCLTRQCIAIYIFTTRCQYGFNPLIYFPKCIYIRFVIIHPRNW